MRKLVIWSAVLTALALVFSFDPLAFTYLAEAKVGRVKSDVRVLSDAVEDYKAKHGKHPEQLATLVEVGPTCGFGNPPLDPWGNEYRYDPEGKRNGGKKADVWTITPDGKEIGNWLME
jgi:hypothetical protein